MLRGPPAKDIVFYTATGAHLKSIMFRTPLEQRHEDRTRIDSA
jgi:hypothetical protein